MKRSGTVLIFVIVWVAVLFASFVIGIGVREVRFHRARTVVEATKDTETTTLKVTSKIEKLSEAEKLAQELAQKAPLVEAGGDKRVANRPAEPGTEEVRGKMRERFGNMSEERAQMRERMGGRRREGGMRERFRNMSEAEMQVRREEQDREGYRKLQEVWPTLDEETREKIRGIQERWPTMSEEEKDRVRAGNLD